MRIEMLLFATVADQVGATRIELDLPAASTVSDALDALEARHVALSEMRPALAVAVNHVYADPATALSEGDEVALIPPVSGG